MMIGERIAREASRVPARLVGLTWTTKLYLDPYRNDRIKRTRPGHSHDPTLCIDLFCVLYIPVLSLCQNCHFLKIGLAAM